MSLMAKECFTLVLMSLSKRSSKKKKVQPSGEFLCLFLSTVCSQRYCSRRNWTWGRVRTSVVSLDSVHIRTKREIQSLWPCMWYISHHLQNEILANYFWKVSYWYVTKQKPFGLHMNQALVHRGLQRSRGGSQGTAKIGCCIVVQLLKANRDEPFLEAV